MNWVFSCPKLLNIALLIWRYRVLPKPYEVWVMTSSAYLTLVWTKVVSLHSRYFLVQSQLWKHQDNVWNLFKLTTKTPERRQWRRYGVFIVNVEQISHIVLVFPLLTLNKQMLAGWVLLLPKFIDNSSCQLEHFCVIIWEWLVKSFKLFRTSLVFATNPATYIWWSWPYHWKS